MAMKNKLLSLMTAILVVMGIFAMPITVSATGGEDTTPPELIAVIDGENLKVSATDDVSGVEGIYVNDDWVTDSSATVPLKDYGDSQICVYAVDYAGNYSEVIILENPSYEETTSSIPDGALTPEGTGTILDSVSDGDKQFYTITSEAGNVFYLIIDSSRDSNNVYFLNTVTEDDLLALAEKSGGTISSIPTENVCTCSDRCEAGQVNTSCAVCKNDLTGCKGTVKVTEPEETITVEPVPEESDGGTMLFLLIGFGVVCGVGYYVKIVRPKQQSRDDDFEDEDYGEGFNPDTVFGTQDADIYIDDEDGV